GTRPRRQDHRAAADAAGVADPGDPLAAVTRTRRRCGGGWAAAGAVGAADAARHAQTSRPATAADLVDRPTQIQEAPMSPRHQHTEAPMSVKIPADVDQPDKILYGLTARQLAILAGTAALCLWLLLTLGPLVPIPVLVAVLVPVVAAGVVLA